MSMTQDFNKTESIFRVAGVSGGAQKINRLIGRLASHDATVFLMGEEGVGKELLARELHRRSERNQMPFFSLDCRKASEDELEVKLFGQQIAAGNDLHRKPSIFELAKGGTLLLQNVDHLSLSLQTRLLWALQTCEILPCGGIEKVAINVRLVVSTNQDLRQTVKNGGFRKDLFYRLDVLSVQIPALRERTEDIAGLLQHFSQADCSKRNRPAVMFSLEAVHHLTERYPWDGNVAELKNMVGEIIDLYPAKQTIELQDLPARYLEPQAAVS